MAWGIKEQYFSGQGVVLVAKRGLDGQPLGFRPVGNVPALSISVETSTTEHKESTTGQRGTDLRLTTETNCSLSFTLENFMSRNLADSLRGEVTVIPGATVTGKPVKAYPGLITGLDKVRLSAVAVKKGATALTPYTDVNTAWDYQVNTEAGSLKFNDGSAQALGALGEAITAATPGATTSLAIANSAAVVGGDYAPSGFGGTGAGLINGKTFTVLSVTVDAVVINANTQGKTLTGAGKGVAGGTPVLVDYTYADQVVVDALTTGAPELYMRFEGLNTVDENAPVVVDVFRFLTDPLQELALISDTTQQFVLEGSVLADTSRPTGSKYFSVRKLS